MDPQKTPSNSMPGANPASNSADNTNNEVTVSFGSTPTSPAMPNSPGAGGNSIPDASLSSDPATPVSNTPDGGTAPFQPVQPEAPAPSDPFAAQPTITGETPPATPPTGSFAVSSPVPPNPGAPGTPPAQPPFGNPVTNPTAPSTNTATPQPDLVPAANTAHDKKTILILAIVAVVLIAAIAALVFFK